MKHPTTALAPLLLALAAACGDEGGLADSGRDRAEREATRAARAAADSAEAALAPVPFLDAADESALRSYLNAEHVAAARELGVEPVEGPTQVQRLVASGELVPLGDSTTHWIVRELDHSLPYVTPDARAMLVELGRRFHARLDSIGAPHYRFEISSVLRTSELQAELRARNSNASRTTSSHEFGTTVDVAYNEFSPPARAAATLEPAADPIAPTAELRARVEDIAREALGEVADERSDELKAILGEVLREMQEEGRVQALLERAQPVYHLTVARDYPAPAARPSAE